MGDIKKIRLPRVTLYYITCTITDMTDKTKQTPITGINNAFPEKEEIAAINPPKASEPVSPMNTDAGDTLNAR